MAGDMKGSGWTCAKNKWDSSTTARIHRATPTDRGERRA